LAIVALTFKVAPEATVTLLEPNALLLDATSVPLLVTTNGRLKAILVPLNTKVPASATSVPFALPDIFPDKTNVLPVCALKILVAKPTFAMLKLLVKGTDIVELVAHSFDVNIPKVVTPELVVPIFTSHACAPRLLCPAT
jgi:hypothetical protein